jgi:outer membrane protein assembly factor BamB
MKISINKTKMTATMIILLMIASATLITLPLGKSAGAGGTNQAFNGDTYDYTRDQGYKNPQHIYGLPLPAGVTPDMTIPTIAHISIISNTIGLGQDLLVNVWVSPNVVGLRMYNNFNIIFTKPDGTTDTQTISSFIGDGTGFLDYYPNVAGNWSVKFEFPGAYFPAGNYTTPIGTFVTVGTTQSFLGSTYYPASSDGPYYFTVQPDYVYTWPYETMPTDYWTRPINLMNRGWGEISGWYPATGQYGGVDPYPGNWPADTNWYMSNYNYIPYVQGPNSSHMLWRRQDSFASGIIGGPLSQQSSGGSGSQPSIVYDGNMYRTVTQYYNGVATSVYQCSDLRTGEIHWERTNIQAPSYVIAVNPGPASSVAYATQSSGESTYLAGIQTINSTLHKLFYLNPGTGATSQNVTIDPLTSGTLVMCSDYPYFLSIQTIGSGASAQYRLVNWTIFGNVTSSVNQGTPVLQVISNISCAFSSLYSTTDFQAGYTVTSYSFPVGPAGSSNVFYNSGVVDNQGLLVYSLTTGQLVQNITTDIPGQHFQSSSSLMVDHGRIAVDFDDGRVHCWDCATGKKLWTSTYTNTSSINGVNGWPWDTFYEYGVSSYGGNYLIGTYAGILALNWTDGSRSWLYRSMSPAALESPYQNYNPFFTDVREADGKVYGYSSEHTPSQPTTRSWGTHCVNATTGEEIWSLMGGGSPGAIADGYLTTSSADGYFNVIGRGQSATTVTASPKTSIGSDKILIEGTVLDQSPAQPGTPCVAKESMSQQMNYLHMQQPVGGIFNNVTVIGVPVSLLAMASDGTYTDLGTVTTNGYYGTFSLAWTPPKADTYTIVATFHADDSYGSSSAATAVAVSPAPAATTTATPTPTTTNLATTSDLMTYIVVAAIAIIIAIAIVGVLVLRKHA